MKNAIRSATQKKAMWRVSILITAIFLLLGVNAIAQLDVKKTSTPITIDGNLSDCAWANANFVTFTNAVAGIPTLAATTAVTAITNTTATSGGNVTYDGGYSVTARGVCWATTANPTTANSKTTNGTGTGTFTSSLTGLTAGTLYYVRAYATNSAGTGYGAQVSFTTTGSGGWHAPTPTDPWVESVMSHGAVPNDGIDDTQAIQATVDWLAANHSGGTVLVPAGTFRVIKGSGLEIISLHSNMTFKLDAGALIEMDANAASNYHIIHISGCTNVNVIGPGTVKGDKHTHQVPVQLGWGGYAFFTGSSSNIYFDGVTGRECIGDGFLAACNYEARCYNIYYYNCVATDNERQGMSIENVDGMEVRNCIFQTTGGIAPQSGVDIEPADPALESVSHVLFDNCQFINNASGAGLLLEGQPSSNIINYITVTNCIITGNGWGLVWRNPGTGSSYSGNTISGNSQCNLYLPGETCAY